MVISLGLAGFKLFLFQEFPGSGTRFLDKTEKSNSRKFPSQGQGQIFENGLVSPYCILRALICAPVLHFVFGSEIRSE